jgi:hypothetical protein
VVGSGEEIDGPAHPRASRSMKASLEVSARAWNAVEVNMENVADCANGRRRRSRSRGLA